VAARKEGGRALVVLGAGEEGEGEGEVMGESSPAELGPPSAELLDEESREDRRAGDCRPAENAPAWFPMVEEEAALAWEEELEMERAWEDESWEVDDPGVMPKPPLPALQERTGRDAHDQLLRSAVEETSCREPKRNGERTHEGIRFPTKPR